MWTAFLLLCWHAVCYKHLFHEKWVFMRFRLRQAHRPNAPVANAIRPIDRINMEITKINWTFYVWSRENETWICNTGSSIASKAPTNELNCRSHELRNACAKFLLSQHNYRISVRLHFQFVRPNEKQLHFAHLEHVHGLLLATIAMPKSH